MKKYFYIVFLLIFLISCSEVIDIKVDEKEKKIVLNSIITPDSLIKVHLTKSIGVLEADSNVKFIENAQIQLFENDNFIENLTYDKNGYYNSKTFPKIGNIYTLKATNNELQDIETKTTIPTNVAIKNITYKIDSIAYPTQMYDVETNTFYDTIMYTIDKFKVNVTFDDAVDTKNYYYLCFANKNPIYDYLTDSIIGERYFFTYYSLINSDNYTYFYMDGLNGYMVSDNFFNGKQFTINADLMGWGGYLPTLYIFLISISEDFYNYAISNDKYREASYNPLAEPVNVFSNIKNGFGIFTSYSVSIDSLVFN